MFLLENLALSLREPPNAEQWRLACPRACTAHMNLSHRLCHEFRVITRRRPSEEPDGGLSVVVTSSNNRLGTVPRRPRKEILHGREPLAAAPTWKFHFLLETSPRRFKSLILNRRRSVRTYSIVSRLEQKAPESNSGVSAERPPVR